MIGRRKKRGRGPMGERGHEQEHCAQAETDAAPHQEEGDRRRGRGGRGGRRAVCEQPCAPRAAGARRRRAAGDVPHRDARAREPFRQRHRHGHGGERRRGDRPHAADGDRGRDPGAGGRHGAGGRRHLHAGFVRSGGPAGEAARAAVRHGRERAAQRGAGRKEPRYRAGEFDGRVQHLRLRGQRARDGARGVAARVRIHQGVPDGLRQRSRRATGGGRGAQRRRAAAGRAGCAAECADGRDERAAAGGYGEKGAGGSAEERRRRRRGAEHIGRGERAAGRRAEPAGRGERPV